MSTVPTTATDSIELESVLDVVKQIIMQKTAQMRSLVHYVPYPDIKQVRANVMHSEKH